MRIAILDFYRQEYDAESILHSPLGGTQSAVIETSISLSKEHVVTLYNGISQPQQFERLQIKPNVQIRLDELGACDWIIFVSTGNEEFLKHMPLHNGRTRVALWAHHDVNQPAVQFLMQASARNYFSRFLFVSGWQAQRYAGHFSIARELIAVVGNPYCARALANSPVPEKNFDAPRMVYTSTPYRGLNVLVDAFPLFAQKFPSATLKILSGMEIYGDNDSVQYRDLFARISNTPGISLIKPAGKVDLYRELASANLHPHPSTFAETFCIAALESRLMGNPLLMTPLGALPEVFPQAQFYDAGYFGELSGPRWAQFMTGAWDRIRAVQEGQAAGTSHESPWEIERKRAVVNHSPDAVAQRFIRALSQ